MEYRFLEVRKIHGYLTQESPYAHIFCHVGILYIKINFPMSKYRVGIIQLSLNLYKDIRIPQGNHNISCVHFKRIFQQDSLLQYLLYMFYQVGKLNNRLLLMENKIHLDKQHHLWYSMYNKQNPLDMLSMYRFLFLRLTL
jgi:hypothetical protein